MSSDGDSGWIARFRGLPNDSPAKTLAVALGVALVCAVLVSTTAVLLKPRQEANRERERRDQILKIVERLPGLGALLETVAAEQIEAQVIELATGSVAAALDPATYDQRKAAQDPQSSVALAPEDDIARIGRRANHATVYLVRREGKLALVILPVHGGGYASTLYGFLALEGDGETVVALTFYEHAETPGMGARIGDPDWSGKWTGKKLRDAEGRVTIGVAAGPVDPASPAAAYQVDAISGATRTGQGVTNLLRFWLGDLGFGPYLDTLRRRGT